MAIIVRSITQTKKETFQWRCSLKTFLSAAVMLCMMAGCTGLRVLADAGNMQPVVLRCESLLNPLGVDRLQPRLSWKLQSGKRGQKQTAYRILVASSRDKLDKNTGDLWDSKKVKSDKSIYLAYNGQALQPNMQCFWKVMAWDRDGKASNWSEPAFWKMGIISPQYEDKYKHRKENNYEESNKPMWIWHGNEPNVKFRRTINLDKVPDNVRVVMGCDNASVFKINGKEICKTDNWQVAAVVDVTKYLKSGNNLLEIDGKNTGGAAGLLVSIAIKGKEKDDFRFVVSDKDWQVSGGSPDKPKWLQATELGAYGMSPWGALYEINPTLPMPDDWTTAKWITHPSPKRLSHPWLRHTFDLKEDFERAEIHINTASFNELYINGKKVTPYVLAPGISKISKRFLINTYDVNSYLVKGKNCIALWMGPGWHQPRTGNKYNAPILRAQLNVYSQSGLTEIGTDSSWRIKESCISQIGSWSWSNFGGEHYDAREFVPGWDRADLNDSDWLNALEIPAPTVIHSWQGCESARLSASIVPKKLYQLDNGKWVIDFGRPLTGWMRLKMHDLKAGQNVTVIYADVCDKDNKRMLAHMPDSDGFNSFGQVDVFISAGVREETFCSRFNYHSFRYAVISGLARKPAPEDVQAMMIEPELESAGQFECSNDLLNRIHEITRYTLRTQNPVLALGTGEAREKHAYGDGGAHLSGYLYNFNCGANFRKWIRDWSDNQRFDGFFGHTAPAFETHGGGPPWGGQASELVRRMCTYYGDTDCVDLMYNRLRKYVDYVESNAENGILKRYSPRGSLHWNFIGDWVRPTEKAGAGFYFDTMEEREFFNNCYRVLLWQQLQDYAEILGKTDEVARCREHLTKIRPIIHEAFYKPDKGTYTFNNQGCLTMALYAQVPPSDMRDKFLAQLEHDIVVNKKGHLDTGLLGTFLMLDLLIKEDRNDLVALMMGQTTYPGWGFLVKEMGLTTWPETWSGWGSQVILVTATPGAWFFEGLGGIRPDPKAPGFKHFMLRPGIVKSVDWVKCSYESPYGRIVSNWKLENGSFNWDVKVPVNSTATIHLPAKRKEDISEGSLPLDKAEGLKFLRMEKGRAVLQLESGSYSFVSSFDSRSKTINTSN